MLLILFIFVLGTLTLILCPTLKKFRKPVAVNVYLIIVKAIIIIIIIIIIVVVVVVIIIILIITVIAIVIAIVIQKLVIKTFEKNSRPRPRLWSPGLETKTKTLVTRSRD